MKLLYALIVTFLFYPVYSSGILSMEEEENSQIENLNLVHYASPIPQSISEKKIETDAHNIYQDIDGITDDCLRCGIYTWTIGGNLASICATIFTTVATVGMGASTTGWIPEEWDIYVKGGATIFGVLATALSVVDESSEGKINKLKDQLTVYLQDNGIDILANSDDV